MTTISTDLAPIKQIKSGIDGRLPKVGSLQKTKF